MPWPRRDSRELKIWLAIFTAVASSIPLIAQLHQTYTTWRRAAIEERLAPIRAELHEKRTAEFKAEFEAMRQKMELRQAEFQRRSDELQRRLAETIELRRQVEADMTAADAPATTAPSTTQPRE